MKRTSTGRAWLPILSLLLVLASTLQLLVHSAPAGTALSDVCFAASPTTASGDSGAGSAADASPLCPLCVAAAHGGCIDTAPARSPTATVGRPQIVVATSPTVCSRSCVRARAPPRAA